MQNILVYDVEAKRIDEICEKHDITEAELIEALLDNATDEDLDEIL